MMIMMMIIKSKNEKRNENTTLPTNPRTHHQPNAEGARFFNLHALRAIYLPRASPSNSNKISVVIELDYEQSLFFL